ncbi:MAG: 16S rRNA (cytosine(967)-C(5))-methyltransferase RsmB [Lachnospiraceae bacterium]|nr:16S rRNA (cytosine(967)-C(5))-methyltransferase RsmB [Lachnospiraceae bacterium]
MADYQNVREISLEVVTAVMEQGGFIHLTLARALEKYDYLDPRDKALITRISSETVENCILIDAVLDRFSSVKVRKMKPFIRSLLRISTAQILFLNGIPHSAVCNEAVKMASAHGFRTLKGFVNGVLRSICREKDANGLTEFLQSEDLALRCSVPKWLFDRLSKVYTKEQMEKMLLSDASGREVTVHILTSRKSVSEIMKLLEEDGVAFRRDPDFEEILYLTISEKPLSELTAFAEGYLQVQDKSSILAGIAAASLLKDPENSICLDLCAAPGGKSIALADHLKGNSRLLSMDLSEDKCELIRENADRTDSRRMEVICRDASVPDEERKEIADLILCDVPCSGLGILRKKGDIKYHLTEERLASLDELQKQILKNAYYCLKEGGALLYSTCTVLPEENDLQREWILQNFPDLEPVSLEGVIPACYGEGSLKEGRLQLLQGIHDTDGFYFAAFRKKVR